MAPRADGESSALPAAQQTEKKPKAFFRHGPLNDTVHSNIRRPGALTKAAEGLESNLLARRRLEHIHAQGSPCQANELRASSPRACAPGTDLNALLAFRLESNFLEGFEPRQ